MKIFFESVRQITGIIIEPLGENSFILKGDKNTIKIARDMIEQFSNTPLKLFKYTYYELPDGESFETAEKILENYFVFKGLGEDDYTLDLTGDNLLYVVAPENYLDEAISQLDYYKPYITSKVYKDIVPTYKEIMVEFSNEEIKSLITQLSFQVEVLDMGDRRIIIGPEDQVVELDRILKELSKINETQQETDNSSETTTTDSTKTTTDIPVASSKTFVVVENLVDVNSLDPLFKSMNVEVEFIPLESKTVMYGTEYDVNRANSIYEQVGKLFVKEGKTFFLMELVPGTDIDKINDLLKELEIDAQVSQIEGQLVIIGLEEEALKAKELIDSIKDNINLDIDQKYYEITQVPTYTDIDNLNESLKQLNINAEIIKVQYEKSLNSETETTTTKSSSDTESESNEYIKTSNYSYANTLSVMVVGTKDGVTQAMELLNGLTPKEEEKILVVKTFKIIEERTSITILEMKDLFERLGIGVEGIEIGGKKVLIGTEEEIGKGEEVLKGFVIEGEEEKEKSYEVIAGGIIDEGEVAKVKEVAEKTGIEIEIISIDGKIVLIGTTNDISATKGIITEINKEGEKEAEEYEILEKIGLSGAEANTLIEQTGLGVKVEEVGGKIVLVGVRGEIEKAKEILSKFEVEEEETESEKTYKTVKTPAGFVKEEIEKILSSLGIGAEIVETGEIMVITGTEDEVEKAGSIIEEVDRLSVKEEGKELKYEVVEGEGVELAKVTEALGKLGIPAEIVESGTKIMIIGSEDEIEDTKKLVETFRPETEDEEKTYTIIEIKTGTDTGKMGEILNRLGIEAELEELEGQIVVTGYKEETEKAKEIIESLNRGEDVTVTKETVYEIIEKPEGLETVIIEEAVNNIGTGATVSEGGGKLIIIGTEEGIEKTKELIEKLKPETGEEQKAYKIIEDRTSITIVEMKDLYERLGIGVEGIEIGGKKVLIGTEEEIGKGEEVLKGFVIEGEEEKEKSYEVIAGGIIDEGEVAKVKEVAEKTGIEIEIISIDGKIVLIGTTNDISATKGIITEINKEGEKEAEEYEILEKIGLSGAEANTLIEQTGLGVKVEEVGGKIVLVGVRGEIEKAKEILSKFEVEEEETESEKTYKTVKTPAGFVKEEIEKILSSLGIGAEIVETGEIMVITGTEDEVEKAGSIIEEVDRLSVKEEGKELKYEVVEGEGVELAKVTEALGKLGIPAEIVESGTKIMIIGSEDEIEDTKKLVETFRPETEDEEKTYTIIEIKTGTDTGKMGEILNRLGIEAELEELEGQIVVTGYKEETEKAKEIIESLNRGEDVTVTKETVYEIIEKPEGLETVIIEEAVNNIGTGATVSEGGGKLIIIGTEEGIEKTKELIEKLKPETGEEQKAYKIIEDRTSITIVEMKDLYERLGIGVEGIEIGGKKVLIGTEEEIGKGEEVLKGFVIEGEEEKEKSYEVIAGGIIDEGEVAKVKEVAEKTGIEIEIISIDGKIVLIGTTNDISATKGIITEINKEGEKEAEEYEILEKIGLSGAEANTLIEQTALGVKVEEVGGKIVLVGVRGEIEKAKEILSKFEVEEEETESEKTYKTVKTPAGFVKEEIEKILSSLGIGAEIVETGEIMVITGTEDEVEKAGSIIEEVDRLSVKEEGKELKYEVVEGEGVELAKVTEALGKLGIPAEIVESGTKIMIIGSEDEIEDTKKLVETFRPETEDEEKTYTIIEIKTGTDTGKMGEILNRLGIEAELEELEGQIVVTGYKEETEKAKEIIESLNRGEDVTVTKETVYEIIEKPEGLETVIIEEAVNNIGTGATVSEGGGKLIIIGTEEGIEKTKELIEKLKPETGEEQKAYKIIEDRTSITILEMKDLFERLGIGVEGIEIGGKKVLIGTEEEIGKGEEVLKGFVIEGEEEKEKSYEVIAGGIIDEGEVAKVKEVAEKTGIEIEIISIDGKIVLIGTTNDISATKGIITEINKEGEKEAEEYEILEKIGLSGAEANTLIEQTALGVKVEEVGGKIVLVGVRGEIEKAKEILSKFEVEEEETESEKTYKTVKTPAGFVKEEIEKILSSLGIGAEIVETGEIMVITGTEDEVEKAGSIIEEVDRLSVKEEGKELKYEVVEGEGVELAKVTEALGKLGIPAEIVESGTKIMIIGSEDEIEDTKKLVETFRPETEDEEKTYTIIEIKTGTDTGKMGEILNRLGIEAELEELEGQIVVTGYKEETEKAKEIIESLNRGEDVTVTKETVYEIIEKPEGLETVIIEEAVNNIGTGATVSEGGGKLIIIGTEEGIEKTKELIEKLKPETGEEQKAYKIIEDRTSITIVEMKDLYERLGIGVEGIEIGGKKVLIGTEEEIGKGEEVLKGFVIEGEEEKEKSYEVIAGGIIDEGEVAKVKEVAEKTGIEIEIISIDGKIVLIGTTNDISATKGIITEINKEGEKEAEEYEILEKIGLSGAEANTLIEQTALGVKVEEVGGKIVLVGVRGEIEKAKEILSKFEVEEEETESEKTYKTVKTPAGFVKEEIEKILSSLGIGAEIVETGEIMVITGTEDEVEKAGSIIEEVDRLSVKEEGKELKYEVVEGEGVELAKVTEALGKLGIPAEIVESGTKIMIIGSEDEIEDAKEIIKTLKDVDVQVDESVYEIIDVPENVVVDDLLNAVNMSEYNFKYSILKNRILIYGDKKDVLSVKDLIEKFIPIVPEKEESDVMFVEYINGINAELIKTYLDANDLNNVDVFAIQNGYLIIGSKNEIEDSKKMIDFIKSKVEKEYLVISIPKGFDEATLDELITNEDLNVNLIVLTDEDALVNGDKNDIKKLEEILALIPESEENEVEYKLIDIKEEIDISEINALLKSLNYEVEISKIGNSEIIIGDATNTSESFEVLDDLKFLSEAPLKEIIEYFKPEYITVEDLLNILNSTYEDGVTFEAFASLNMIIIKSYDEEKISEIIEFSENLDEEAKMSDKLINNIEIKDDSISVNLKDQNVEELLKYISEEMQESLVFSNVIDEEITLNVKDISWVGLLDIISLTKPVEYEVINGTYFVKKIQEDELAGDTSEQIYRIYQNAQDFADLVQFYGGTAQVDELNGIVVIKGISKESVANIMNEVGDTLKSPKKQVEIESVLVDVDETVDLVKKLELYLKSDVLSVTQTTANLELGILDITNPTAVIEDILMGGSVGANIEFSNTLGDAQIISSPSVVAMSGEEGRVHIGDTIPQLVPTLDASRNMEFKLEYIQSGVDLKVTPKVLDNGKISMKIYIEVSEPQVYKFFYDDKEFEYYGKNEKTFESNLVISDGNTLVIGGLKRQDTKKTTKKTPGLSDLPFLGALFKPNDTLTDNNRTLTIFLTARIIEP